MSVDPELEDASAQKVERGEVGKADLVRICLRCPLCFWQIRWRCLREMGVVSLVFQKDTKRQTLKG